MAATPRTCRSATPSAPTPWSASGSGPTKRSSVRHFPSLVSSDRHDGNGRMKFTGTSRYITTRDLEIAVNASVTLGRPLLVKGEPGTGKTVLAEEVAAALKLPLIAWHIKSTTKAAQGLYEYDAVARLRDGQLGDERVKDIRNYIIKGKLWNAFESETPVVLLIDEIDKADIE